MTTKIRKILVKDPNTGETVDYDIASNDQAVENYYEMGTGTTDTPVKQTVSMLEEAQANERYAVAIGYYAKAGAIKATAIGAEVSAQGEKSVALGHKTKTHPEAVAALAEGDSTHAYGEASHVEGTGIIAPELLAGNNGENIEEPYSVFDAEQNKVIVYSTTRGKASHAEGAGTFAAGTAAHAEGVLTQATDDSAHAEGNRTRATQPSSHAEGYKTSANDTNAHAEGEYTVANGQSSHAEGINTRAELNGAHAEGYKTEALEAYSHAEGEGAKAGAIRAHAEGYKTEARGNSAHAEGENTYAYGEASHAEGGSTGEDYFRINNDPSIGPIVFYDEDVGVATKCSTAYGYGSHAEGIATWAKGFGAHAEGEETQAEGLVSHAEGFRAIAQKAYSHAEGEDTVSKGGSSHAEGVKTYACGYGAHAEGVYLQTREQLYSNDDSSIGPIILQPIEGYTEFWILPTAHGEASHAEGQGTWSKGIAAHAEGYRTNAEGEYSHAEGENTFAYGRASHVQGRYNKRDTYVTEENPYGRYAHIVGGGDPITKEEKNIHTLDWNGNAMFTGYIKSEGVDLEDTLCKYGDFENGRDVIVELSFLEDGAAEENSTEAGGVYLFYFQIKNNNRTGIIIIPPTWEVTGDMVSGLTLYEDDNSNVWFQVILARDWDSQQIGWSYKIVATAGGTDVTLDSNDKFYIKQLFGLSINNNTTLWE